MPEHRPVREGPAWIVVTPSADDEGWRAAIQTAADEAGLILRDATHETPASTDDPDREIWLTSDCDVVESLGRRPSVVLIPRPETAAEAITKTFGVSPPNNMSQASLLIARAAAQNPRHTRIVTSREIAASRDQPIVLIDGLSVRPPTPSVVEVVRPAVRAALEPFSNGLLEAGSEIVWSERIFRYDANASCGQTQIGELDVTGRPRILVYGPYLALTPGRWRARIRFLVDKAASSRDYRFDFGSSHDFATTMMTPPHSGVYEVELEHDWLSADYGEIRFWLMEGTFDGALHFLGATITFVGKAPATDA